MARIQMTLFLLAALGCFLLTPVSAMNHIVGGSFGWSMPMNLSFYQEWAKPRTFGVGDKLVFLYRTGVHNVLEVNKKDYGACSQKDVIDMNYNGPTILELFKAGDYYYYCGVGTHCEGGQKLSITVTNEEGSAGTPFVSDAAGPAATVTSLVKATAPEAPTNSSAKSICNLSIISGLLSFLLSLLI